MNILEKDGLCNRIVADSPDAILFVDRDGIIRLWNRGAELIFGYSANEALGQSLDLIVPEKLRQRHWEGYRQTMATGETRYGTKLLSVPAVNKDGRSLSCEFSIVLSRNEEDAVQGVAAIFRDVTDRFQREKALKERLRAMEEDKRP